jgi:hypothetical protein
MRYLMKVLSISKYSDFSSAKYLLGTGYLEIDLEPDHKKVFIYSKDLAKISMSCLQILLKDCYLEIRTILERAFKREKWVSKNYFELASLINMYYHACDLAEVERSFEKLELLHEKIERFLKQYKRKPYKKVKKLNFEDNRSEEFLANMAQAAIVINNELINISQIYDRIRKIKELIHYLKVSIFSARKKVRQKTKNEPSDGSIEPQQ